MDASAFARQRLRMYPQLLGNSTFMQSVALDEVAAAVAPLQRLLESVSYRGVFSAMRRERAADNAERLALRSE